MTSTAHDGAVTRSGGLGVMRQFIGKVRDDTTVRDLLVSVAPRPGPRGGRGGRPHRAAMMERDDEEDQMAYAHALVDWGDAGGYEQETVWDECTVAALGIPFEQAQYREVATLSGGEQKRLVLEACCAGPTRCCCSTSRTTTSTCRARAGSRSGSASRPRRCSSSATTASCSTDAATRVVTLELGQRRATLVGAPAAASRRYRAGPRATGTRGFEELRRRWDEEHAKLKALVLMSRRRPTYNDGMASRYQAAQTRLREVRGGRAAARQPPTSSR